MFMSNLNEEEIAEYLENMGICRYLVECSVPDLLERWEDYINELSEYEVEYCKLKEEYTQKEFEIVYLSDINFKELYGSTSEKVRKQHASTVLKPLKTKLTGLELSIDYLKRYIVFIRELCKWKRSITNDL